MSDETKDIVVHDSGAIEARDRELDALAREKTIEVATAFFGLLIRGGHVVVDAMQQEMESEAAWDVTRRKIAELDAATLAEIQRLEANLDRTKERTRRLQLILDFLSSHSGSLGEHLESSISKVIEQLATEP